MKEGTSIMPKSNAQRGGVSLFIVIFTSLLVTIVVVSFVSIMLRNQEEATNTDLSSSAYDSAMAGVEDAKRLAVVYHDCKAAGDSTSAKCSAAISGVDNNQCDSIQTGLTDIPAGDEVQIKNNSSDTNSAALRQAYTCVKVTYNTLDVERTIDDGETQMVPLKPANGAAFNKVKITWREKGEDAPYATLPSSPTSLPSPASWGQSPALLRTQVLQTSSSFTLDDFNATVSGKSNMNTVFLYPASAGTSQITPSSHDGRPNASPRSPVSTLCTNVGTVPDPHYSCSMTLALDDPVGGSKSTRKNAYLLLSSIYNSADYTVELFDDSTPVKFGGVQPEVDSTGRANDLFRRVKARVEFGAGQFEYPGAALDINSDLCKAFAITDSSGDFAAGGCTP